MYMLIVSAAETLILSQRPGQSCFVVCDRTIEYEEEAVLLKLLQSQPQVTVNRSILSV